MTFKEQIETYLAPLPSEWREKMTKLLCEINTSQQTVDCQDVKDCETVTSLSPFTTNNSTLSIQYRDERGVTTTRSIDLSQVINNQLEGLDPACLADETSWNNMTLAEKLQLIINRVCEDCEGE